ncbi:MAG: hypothetical protein U9M92_02185 [Patescibacteria group bacterium]|nr:hypothetical protein [Patescibacteria group bacterium]
MVATTGEDAGILVKQLKEMGFEGLIIGNPALGLEEFLEIARDYLYGVENYPGVGGLTTFDENGDVVKPIMLKTIKDGEIMPYEE